MAPEQVHAFCRQCGTLVGHIATSNRASFLTRVPGTEPSAWLMTQATFGTHNLCHAFAVAVRQMHVDLASAPSYGLNGLTRYPPRRGVQRWVGSTHEWNTHTRPGTACVFGMYTIVYLSARVTRAHCAASCSLRCIMLACLLPVWSVCSRILSACRANDARRRTTDACTTCGIDQYAALRQ